MEGNVIILLMAQSWCPEDMWQSSSSNMVSKSRRGLKRSKLSKTKLVSKFIDHLPAFASPSHSHLSKMWKGFFHAPFESA
mgnify:CR=1 FL=1